MGMLSSHGIAVRCIGCFEYLFSFFLPQEVGTWGAGGAALVGGYTAVLYPCIFVLGGIILPL